MPDLLIRNVPKKTIDRLKKLAASRGRSLQQETRRAIEQFAETEDFSYFEEAAQLRGELIARDTDYQDSTETIRQDRRR